MSDEYPTTTTRIVLDWDDPMVRLAAHRQTLVEKAEQRAIEAEAERDRARATAVALEQEVARALEVLGDYNRPVALRVHDVEMLLRGLE